MPGPEMWRVVKTAGEQEVLRLQHSQLDPGLQGVAGSLRDLELHWALRLVLHDDSARRHLVAVTHVPDLERDKIAAAQLAVDSEVEQGEFAHASFHLEADAQRPDVLELEGRLLPDKLALIPRLAMSGATCGSHDGLPSS